MLQYLDHAYIELHSILDETFLYNKHHIYIFQVNMNTILLDVTNEKCSEPFTDVCSLGGYGV